MSGALEGIRVVEIGQEIQGPYASLMLGDMGADVIKVENRETGDLARRTTVGVIAGSDAPHADFHQYFLLLNRGKRSLTLDLKNPRGKEVLMKLLASADVLITNFRPGVLDRLGFGYEALRVVYPRLIYTCASSWGPRGPWARKPSRDMLAQAASGAMAKTGKEEDQPIPAGFCVADYSGATVAFAGTLAALFARERTGCGQRVDTSMFGAMLALQPWEILQSSLIGRENRKAGRGHQFLHGVWGSFKTADGWVALAGVEDDRWPRFCTIIGRPDLIGDPDCQREGRNFRGDKIQKILDGIFPTRTTAEWMVELDAADLFATPVAEYADVLSNPQAEENGYIRWMDHPEIGPFRMVGSPIELSAMPIRAPLPAPRHGEHTEQILGEVGYSAADIAELRAQAAV
jgi:crotonobetainyl-CoA:carnitine CoA-transferase CaiB-like acyl-CoA transferase